MTHIGDFTSPYPSTPVSLSNAATRRLPRWILLTICIIYGITGLFGRDPWKNNDVVGFGVMWNMAHGTLHDWLIPNIAGRIFDYSGPLMFWLGAISIRLLGPLVGDINAARLVTLLCFFVCCALLWRTTYLLGRRSEVQPYPFVFGGQPESRDYGRTLADSALLIFLACIGLVPHLHETTAGMAQITLITLLLYGIARSSDKPIQGVLCCALAFGLLSLTSGPVLTLTLAVCLLVSGRFCREQFKPVILALPIACLVNLLWLFPLLHYGQEGGQYLQAWLRYDVTRVMGPTWEAVSYSFRNLLPYAWPVWPLAIWSLISWHKAASRPHITPSLSLVFGILLLVFLQRSGDNIFFMLIIPPLAVLAAFSLPTLKRTVGNAIDWFALMASTLLIGFIWLVWYAQFTGLPNQTARNLFRLIPGFEPQFDWLAFIISLCASLAWLAIVRWRLLCAPKVIWRSVIIPAAGTTIVWLLLMTLWLPNINYAKTYRDVANAISRVVPKGYRCIYPSEIGMPQLASFAYFTQLRFSEDYAKCDVMLDYDNNSEVPNHQSEPLTDGQWQLIWEGHRPADKDERFRLYIKKTR